MDIFWAWKRYREYMRGRRLSYPRLAVFIILLASGLYGYRWYNRYMAAREAAKPVHCQFHQEVPLVEFVEETEEIINTAVCPSELKPHELWAALTDYIALTKEAYRPSTIEYARLITSPSDIEAVKAHWPEELRQRYDLTKIRLDEPKTTYVYQEHNQIDLIYFWTILAFRPRLVNEAEGVYELEFEQPEGFGNLLFYDGRFRLEPNPDGPGTLVTYVLRQAMPDQLSGEGLLGMASRMIVLEGYLEGFKPFMEEVVERLERLAYDRAKGQTS